MGHIEDELDLIDFIKNNLEFSKKWESKSTENKYVQNVLNHASKRDTGYHGEPDLIYCNDNNQLLILLENKPSVKYHVGDKKILSLQNMLLMVLKNIFLFLCMIC